MGEHTPGPYTLTDEFSDAHYYMTVIAADGDTIVADVVNQHVRGPRAEFGGGWVVDDDTSAANANLIAAAPDLLAALIRLTDYVTASGVEEDAEDAYEDACAAIAKARGEQQ